MPEDWEDAQLKILKFYMADITFSNSFFRLRCQMIKRLQLIILKLFLWPTQLLVILFSMLRCQRIDMAQLIILKLYLWPTQLLVILFLC